MTRARFKDALVAGLLLLAGRRGPRPDLRKQERIVPAAPPSPGAELLALVLLAAGAICAIAFIAVYALDRLPAHTQLLGLLLGLSFLCFAAALIVTADLVVVTEVVLDD